MSLTGHKNCSRDAVVRATFTCGI